MTPSPQAPGLLALLILILTWTAQARPSSANRVQQPANHGLMTSTAPHGGVCNEEEGNGGGGASNNTGKTTITGRSEGEEEEEEQHTGRVPEGFFAAHGPKTAANPLCGRTVHVAWQGGGKGEAVIVGYCDKCWGPVFGGVDVSPGLFAAAGGRADKGGVVEVDWWLE